MSVFKFLRRSITGPLQKGASLLQKKPGYGTTTRRFINISPEIVKEFEENGVVCLRGAFDKKWLDVCEKGIGRNLMSPSIYCDWLTNDDESGSGLFFNDYYNFNKISEYNSYIRESPAAEIARQITSSKRIGLFHEHVFYKEKGSVKETPWHHDQAYYPLNGAKNCSIWMPTRSVSKNVSLEFIKGSHLWNKWFVPRLFVNNENYVGMEELDRTDDEQEIADIQSVIEKLDDYEVLQWNVEPGDCIVFHMKIIHGTSSSMSANKRIVMTTRWIGDDMTYFKRPWKTSPPKELLPKNLNYGDIMVQNIEFMSQVQKVDE